MIKDLIVKDLQQYKDERGWLAEFYREDETDYRFPMAYVSMTIPGQVRGPHEHVHQTDYFVFVGPGTYEVNLWDAREDSETKGEHMKIVAGEDEPKAVIIPPGVVHGYKCISDKPALSVNLPNKLYMGENKKEEIDEIRHEEDKNSPYKI